MERECDRCKILQDESLLEESHDVPCYLFPGKDRKEKKNFADKWGRRYLCKKCHDVYERLVMGVIIKNLEPHIRESLAPVVKRFSTSYFKEERADGKE